MNELRRSTRVPVDTMRVGLIQGGRITHGNVSLMGVGFEVLDPCSLRPGDPIEVALFLPDEILRIRAVVRRIERAHPRSVGRSFVGAELMPMDELIANPLFRFVEETALLHRPTL